MLEEESDDEESSEESSEEDSSEEAVAEGIVPTAVRNPDANRQVRRRVSGAAPRCRGGGRLCAWRSARVARAPGPTRGGR